MSKLTHASKLNPCPICTPIRGRNGVGWCYELSDRLWVCKRVEEAPIGWRRTTRQDRDGSWMFAVEDGSRQDWAGRMEELERIKADRAANELQAKQQEFKTQLTAPERDPLIRTLSAELGLTGQHRQMLRSRGLTDEQIKAGLFFSIEQWQKVSDRYPYNLPGVYLSTNGEIQLNGKGIAIVTFDGAGLATGWQVMNDEPRPRDPQSEFSKYYWAKGEKSSHLPLGDGELPIQVVGTPTNPHIARLCEGTLKPMIAAHLHLERFIGAASGLFRSSPIQVKTALADVKTVVLTVAGDIINPHRVRHWRLESEFFQSLGKDVQFAWWGQRTKEDNDNVWTLSGSGQIQLPTLVTD